MGGRKRGAGRNAHLCHHRWCQGPPSLKGVAISLLIAVVGVLPLPEPSAGDDDDDGGEEDGGSAAAAAAGGDDDDGEGSSMVFVSLFSTNPSGSLPSIFLLLASPPLMNRAKSHTL